MKKALLTLAILAVPVSAFAQSGPVNVDEVFTIRSVQAGGNRLVVHPDKPKKPGETFQVDVRTSTQILSKNRPMSADMLKRGWHIEIRGNRSAARLIKAEVIVVKAT
jgi:hypothetical protein